MSNPSREKGTRWESSVAAFFRDRGHTEVFRLAPAGAQDAGDIGGLRDFALECRDRSKFNLAENVRDADLRAHHKQCRFGVAILKRRGRSTGEGYAVMTLATFVDIVTALADEGTRQVAAE